MTATTITKQNDTIIYANRESAYFQQDGKILASLPDNSTAIEFWYYDLTSNQLVVQYRKSETYYRYEGVPFQVVFDLMLADSLGSFIAKEVKPNYSVA
jgi:hypothetical protein